MKAEIIDLGNGLIEVTILFDNGKVCSKHQLLNGKLHGEEVWFYESEQIRRKRIWDNGVLIEEIRYYESGHIELKIRYNEDGSIAKY